MSNMNPKVPKLEPNYRGEFEVAFDFEGYHFIAKAEWLDYQPDDLGSWEHSEPTGVEPFRVVKCNKADPRLAQWFLADNVEDHAQALSNFRRANRFEKGDWCYLGLVVKSYLPIDSGDPQPTYVELMESDVLFVESDQPMKETQEQISENAWDLIGMSRQRLIEIHKAYHNLCQEHPL